MIETVENKGPDSASTVGAESSSHMDTDVKHMMDFQDTGPTLLHDPGAAKMHVYPICNAEIYSCLALICHMKEKHAGVKLYHCELCDSHFNNLKEMSNHKSAVHREVSVKCIS